MSTHDLDEPLERLRAEIGKLDDDDKAVKRRMRRLVTDLERRLETAEEAEDESLIDTLRYSIEQFEVEHPRLTSVLNRIMVHLSNIGI